MKRCPKCNIEYFDQTLEFCLEDGTRLISIAAVATMETETISVPRTDKANFTTEKTVQLPFSSPPDALEFSAASPAPQTIPQTDLIKEKVARQSDRILEIAPFVVALAHNWWQWIYLNSQYYSSFSGYVLSANFLMWLLLLLTGAATGLLALKRCRNKGFVFAGLIVLSINLILFLVPKR